MTTTTLTKTPYQQNPIAMAAEDHALHLSAIGAWYQIGGVLALAAAVLMPLLMGGLGLIGSAFMGGIGAVAFAIGHGLRNHQGWARIAAGVLIALSFLGQVNGLLSGQVVQSALGVAWNVAVLWALFGQYGNLLFESGPRHGDEGPFYRSPFFYVPLLPLLVGMMFLVAAIA